MENLYLYIYGNTILAFVFIYVNKAHTKEVHYFKMHEN